MIITNSPQYIKSFGMLCCNRDMSLLQFNGYESTNNEKDSAKFVLTLSLYLQIISQDYFLYQKRLFLKHHTPPVNKPLYIFSDTP